ILPKASATTSPSLPAFGAGAPSSRAACYVPASARFLGRMQGSPRWAQPPTAHVRIGTQPCGASRNNPGNRQKTYRFDWKEWPCGHVESRRNLRRGVCSSQERLRYPPVRLQKTRRPTMIATRTKPFLSLTAEDLMTRDLVLIPSHVSLRTAARMLSS